MRLKNLIKYQSGGLTVDKIQNIINRYSNGKSPLTANDYIEVSKSTGVPVDLLLAQGIQESNFGTKGRAIRTKNVGNVGNTDNGTANYQNSWKNGLYRQATLLKNEYKVKDSSDIQRLVSNDFVRPIKGGKYASDPNYGLSIGRLLNSLHGKKVYDLNGGTSTNTTQNYAQYNTPIDPNMKPVDWSQNEYTNYLDNIYKYDFNTLPANLQQTVIDNQKLQNDKLNQEIEADRLQKENMAIEQSLQQKALEREQLIASIPQAEFVDSNTNLKINPLISLFENDYQTMQKGGIVNNFKNSINFEKDYLKGKKVKERLLKAGFNKPERQIDFLKNQLDEVTLNSINDKDEAPAYYDPYTNEVFYNKSRKQAYDKDTIPHEIGHIFKDTNKLNEKLIDDRNTFIKEKGWDKFIQKLKLRYDIDASYHTHEGHEAEWGETVADVHAARQELLKKGFDGRFSNFTNDAYDKMREIANTDIGSASARLLNKIGAKKSEEDYYNNVLIKYGNGDDMTEEEMKVVKDYNDFQKRNNKLKKKYIFDIMNKVVSNDNNSDIKPQYAQSGGVIDSRGKKIYDKEAKNNFINAIKFEKEYLKSKKIKERIQKADLDVNDELERLNTRLNDVNLVVDESSSNPNGASYNEPSDEIRYSYSSSSNVNQDTMSHEVGHVFGRSNINYSSFIDDRNGLIEKDGLGRAWQKAKLLFKPGYRAGEGHEADWQELIADVHAAREALVPTGYDGRFSNFTNQAYNDMRRMAERDPDSAAGRIFSKITPSETIKYKSLKQYYNQINPNEVPEEHREFIKNYEKNKKKYEDLQKRYIFDVMNKIVSNDNINQNNDLYVNEQQPMYAQMGGKVDGNGINNMLSKLNPKNWFKNDYSDKGTYAQAYSAARNNGEIEFMYKGKRYNTDYNGNPQQQLRETGLTDAQRQNRNIIQKKLSNNINPFGYDNMPSRMYDAVIKDKKEPIVSDNPEHYKKRIDAYNLYNGLPQKNNTFDISPYKPSKSSDKNAIYYRVADRDGTFNNLLEAVKKPFGDLTIDNNIKKASYDSRHNIMGNYTVSTGNDSKGNYISYYDLWDLAPMNYGKPFEIYDKFYYNKYKNKDGYDYIGEMFYNDKELSNMNPDDDNINVANLQKELYQRGYDLKNSIKKEKGYNKSNIFDGIMGDETRTALEKFKNDHKNKK